MQAMEGLLFPPESSSALPLSVPLALISYVHFSSKLLPGGQWLLDWGGKMCLSQKLAFLEHILLSFVDSNSVAEWGTLLIVSHCYHIVQKTANTTNIKHTLQILCFLWDTNLRSHQHFDNPIHISSEHMSFKRRNITCSRMLQDHNLETPSCLVIKIRA